MFVPAKIYFQHCTCKPKKKKVKFAITRLEVPLGLEKVKSPRIARRSAHEVCEFVRI